MYLLIYFIEILRHEFFKEAILSKIISHEPLKMFKKLSLLFITINTISIHFILTLFHAIGQ